MSKKKTHSVAKRGAETKGTRPKRRSSEEVLSRIVDAATEEFKRRGFLGATTAAIAHRAGVTEAQLFRYFRSKSQLFREAIFKPLDEHFFIFFNKHVTRGENGVVDRGITDLYASELQDFITDNLEMFTSLIVAQLYNHDSSRGVAEIDSLHKYFQHTAARMQMTMKGRKGKIDPKLMVRIAFAAVFGCVMFRNWIFPPGLASQDKIRAAINAFVMEGLTANLGHIAS